METTTAAQARLVDELLAWEHERPVVDPGLAGALHAELEAGAAAVLERYGLDGDSDPRDRYASTLWISKSRLDRLVCDGLYRSALEEPFTYSRPVAVGTLSHLAIQRDHDTSRRLPPDELVAHVWQEASTRSRDKLADWCNQLPSVDADAVRQEVEQLLTEHRDIWPLLDSRLHPRFEQAVRHELVGGRVVLLGTPDLTLGRVRDDRARMLLVDFKTGMRRPAEEQQELRFYALLLTLKHGVPPFRWASYYVAEGAWHVEDVAESLLRTAVRRTLDGIEQAARLSHEDAEERLTVGRWCRFCPRRDRCEAYMSQGPGTMEP